MRSELTPAWQVAAGVVAAIATVVVVVKAPVIVSFGAVVAEAVSWCAWLEQHPPA